MSPFTCPEGHSSAAGDYCDVCGAPIAPAAPAAPAADPPAAGSLTLPPDAAPKAAEKVCPNCADPNLGAALFCESCGYDFTTGQMPPPPAAVTAPAVSAPLTPPAGAPAQAAPIEWVAEVWVDPDWYGHEASPGATDPCPAAGMPKVVPLANASVLVGRASASRNIHPDIDCGSDSGVSRRHLQLTLDADHWYAEDLQSTNGTFVAAAGGALPDDAIASGQRHQLGDNDRLYLGAWTRIVLRRATDAEKGP
ncbi:MAG TPA: FHA domain-containing protein [Acidimicrobiales bacterium]|nr:FHA domain-containing protein [Acidimicrobiales bacterium]